MPPTPATPDLAANLSNNPDLLASARRACCWFEAKSLLEQADARDVFDALFKPRTAWGEADPDQLAEFVASSYWLDEDDEDTAASLEQLLTWVKNWDPT